MSGPPIPRNRIMSPQVGDALQLIAFQQGVPRDRLVQEILAEWVVAYARDPARSNLPVLARARAAPESADSVLEAFEVLQRTHVTAA